MPPYWSVSNESEEQRYSNMKLVSACKSNDISLAQYLVEDGFAQINCYSEGKTPLTAALEFKNINIANFLLNISGVNLEHADSLGRTPLYFACYHGLTEIIRIIIPRLTSNNINRRDNYGRSPIMAAVELGKVDSVKEMIKVEEVDLRTVNTDGESLTEVARKNGFLGIFHILQNKVAPERQGLSVSVPMLLVNMKQAVSVPTSSRQHILSQSVNNHLDTLKDKQETAEETLEYKHEKQIREAEKDADILQSIYMNQMKERRALRMKHQTERQRAIAELKSQPRSVECPICLEDMDPPKQIFQCMNGHFICGSCHPKLPSCSLCKLNIIGRAFGMEQFLRILHRV